MSYLALQGIHKRYGEHIAVAGLDLELAQGEFVSLLGPSGCGKTTTLRLIAGFLRPDEGAIRLHGRAIHHEPPYRRHIGVVFQHYALFPHLSVADNVGFGLRIRRVAEAERLRRVQEALALVGLAAFAERYPAQLSGGQQQRTALARALVVEPELLLLDEPLSNLDAALRAEMRDEIRRLQRRLGITTVFVTHDQAEALAMSDRVALLRDGQLMEVASPAALSEQPRHPFTARFLGGRTVLGGAVRDGMFHSEGGVRVALQEDDPRDATYLVLRAARLQLGEASAVPADCRWQQPVTISDSVYLGDVWQHQVTVGGDTVQVLRDSSLPPLSPGATATLWTGTTGLSFIGPEVARR